MHAFVTPLLLPILTRMVMRELISCHPFRNHDDQPGPSNDSNDPQDEAFNPLTVGPTGNVGR